MNQQASASAVHRQTVAVLGASRDPRKYGYKSVLAHQRHGYDVFPINPSAQTIADLKAYSSLVDVPVNAIDRITVYLPPEVGIGLLEEIAAKSPREVWLNPGSESPALLARAEELGLPVIAACSLIDLEARTNDA
jgi:predicted CoA-binding protein